MSLHWIGLIKNWKDTSPSKALQQFEQKVLYVLKEEKLTIYSITLLGQYSIQESTNSSYKKQDSKYSRLCRPYGLCGQYSILPL